VLELSRVCDWEAMLVELRRAFEVETSGDALIPSVRAPDTADVVSRFRECFVLDVLGSELSEAYRWLEYVNRELATLVSRLRLSGFTLPREFKSFREDPLAHLKKKIFIYVYDYARGKLGAKELVRKCASAAYTSLRTNMRSAYQVWGFVAILNKLAERGFGIHYPEHRYLTIDRAGKQRLGHIPPNVVLFSVSRGFLSFFYEAPRPLAWEDSRDLQVVWSFYTVLRPDLLVYSGKVMDIVDLGSSPPVRRPDALVEFKELSDWYERSRDLKSYLRKAPLTAEEWRSKWLEGLYVGLADALGIKRAELRERVREGTGLRVREYKLVELYVSMYRPRRAFLVARAAVPREVRSELESYGIEVVDGVGFDAEKLDPVVDGVESLSSFAGADVVSVELPVELVRRLAKYAEEVGTPSLAEAIDRLLSTTSAKHP